MTLAELEADLEVDSSTLSRYFSGRRLPEIGFLERLHATVERRTSEPVARQEQQRVKSLYYRACAAKEPVRHEVYLLTEKLAACERQLAEANDDVARMRHSLHTATKNVPAVRAELRRVEKDRDRLAALVVQQSGELKAAQTTLTSLDEVRTEADRLRARCAVLEQELQDAQSQNQRLSEEATASELAVKLAQLTQEADAERDRLQKIIRDQDSQLGHAARYVRQLEDELAAQPEIRSRLDTLISRVRGMLAELAPTAVGDEPAIGRLLAQARTQAGLSLDEVAERTGLAVPVLESMENGEPHSFRHLSDLASVVQAVGADPRRIARQWVTLQNYSPADKGRPLGIQAGTRAMLPDLDTIVPSERSIRKRAERQAGLRPHGDRPKRLHPLSDDEKNLNRLRQEWERLDILRMEQKRANAQRADAVKALEQLEATTRELVASKKASQEKLQAAARLLEASSS
ncbi:helix-turn-helix domain-containing protein [Kitasatospora sp. DSM 101779]|uniref:helix-turn-helix domain-containing protein n=1 Tax=Kitasatospora sp. DSM 101779 TaxID=2853165 RepID=UPI0021DA66B2|nr:helix-turn-helix domain-containing protein [Kitasatospora sp. DSM 101779]MCU7827292.1 helix-turn-helix domain-containing protein [Kitasatospora sp. DSM 101779]